MGIIDQKPYRKLNKVTGLFEWVYPPSVEYDKKDVFKPINVITKKKKRKR